MSEMIYDNVIRPETLEMCRGERDEMLLDIYESSDAVRNDEVMINTEMMSTERQQELQHTGRVSVKNRRHRSVQVCLCLLSVLLFTAVIVICVYFINERKQLLTHKYNHLQEKTQLELHINNLTKERDELNTNSSKLLQEEKQCQIALIKTRGLSEERDALMNEKEELKRWLTKHNPRSSNFWLYYNLSFYYISFEWRSWSDSRRDCEQRGANLLIINNEEEQEFVQKATSGQYYYWIGLSKERGVWKWVDGITLTLRFWMNGYPRSYSHGCAVIFVSGWADQSCDFTNKYRWICEKRILP